MILLPIATILQLLQPGRWAVGRAPWKLWMSCLVLQHLRLRLERSVITNIILFAQQNINLEDVKHIRPTKTCYKRCTQRDNNAA